MFAVLQGFLVKLQGTAVENIRNEHGIISTLRQIHAFFCLYIQFSAVV